MLRRFSLYGFLKNQRYFEPFLILIFLEKGMNFFEIGILIAFREICKNVFEIPSGALADTWGRRKSMMISFVSYIVSFVIFALTKEIWMLFVAMFFYAIGDAFRTGTHKAMIFEWLKLHGKEKERTKYYGITRSWSQLGSALSVIISALIIFFLTNSNESQNLSVIFWFSIPVYVFGLINFMGYPKELDGSINLQISFKQIFKSSFRCIKKGILETNLRRILIESMCFDGLFKTVKDYIQPIIKNFALGLAVLTSLNLMARNAILVGIIYFLLYLLSSLASRKAEKIRLFFGGEENSAKFLWLANFVFFVLAGVFLFFEMYLAAAVVFVFIHVLQNIWRPILMTRIDNVSTSEMGATILSVDSQFTSLTTMIFAPLVGFLVDFVGKNIGNCNCTSISNGLWVVGLFGAIISLIFVFRAFIVKPKKTESL